MTMRRLLGGVLAVLLVVGGVACKQSSTDTPEIAALSVKANAGDADAQYNLGASYYIGQGVPQDDAQAMAWFRKAAEQGHPDGQYNLGRLYSRGGGVNLGKQVSGTPALGVPPTGG